MNERRRMRSVTRILLGFIGMALIGFVIFRVVDVVSGRQAAPSGPMSVGAIGGGIIPTSVTVEPVMRGSVEEVSALPGTLEPRYQVDALPRRSGRLENVQVEVGSRVQRGDILATVEHAELLLQAEQSAAGMVASQASLRRAESQLERVKADFERVTSLRERGAATEQELKNVANQLQEAEIQLDVARSQFEQAQVNRKMMQLQLDNVHVDAPVDGVVIRSGAVVGSQVNTSTPIATIAALDPIDVVFHFPERRLAELNVGQRFVLDVDAFPNERFTGEVIQLGAAIESGTRTIGVRGQVQNPDLRLRPGMFARVELVVGRAENALTIPREALMTGSNGFHVYVVEKGDRVAVRPIKLGVQGRERLQVLEGVDEGDVVITVGQRGLREGQLVRPVQAGQPLGGHE